MIKFSTDRLNMTALTTDYLSSTHAYASDPENTLHMLFMPKCSLDETKKYLLMAEREWGKESSRCFEFAILLKREKTADEKDIHIGSLSVYLSEDRTSAEVGWILAKEYWRKGYGLEAAAGLIDWCRKIPGLSRLTAHCDEANLPSRRIMEKLGFILIDSKGRRKNRSSKTESCEYTYLLEFTSCQNPQSDH